MRTYELIPKHELIELRRALESYISELDWACQDTELAYKMLDDVKDEMGERFNSEVE